VKTNEEIQCASALKTLKVLANLPEMLKAMALANDSKMEELPKKCKIIYFSFKHNSARSVDLHVGTPALTVL
jgi:hypothetical protein